MRNGFAYPVVNSIQQVFPALWQGSGTILLADDEEPVRIITKRMLELYGFSVVVAEDGKKALELYQKHSADIVLVLTDIGMPEMDGYELFQELKKLNPGLPIIVISGYGKLEISASYISAIVTILASRGMASPFS